VIQKNELLTREDDCISLACARRTATQGNCLTITERETPVNATEQTWIFEVGEEIPVIRTTAKPVNTLMKIMKWLHHLGSGKIDNSCLESRQSTHHNITIKGIGL
jgi:hypothetical protein